MLAFKELVALGASVCGGMSLGALWYGPLFGKTWAKAVGMTDKKPTKNWVRHAILVTFLAVLFGACITIRLSTMLQLETLFDRIQLALALTLLSMSHTLLAADWKPTRITVVQAIDIGFHASLLLIAATMHFVFV
ncbi:MAG: hypothetical protein MHM6MM_000965 [Cercozoa sp. M6MM]